MLLARNINEVLSFLTSLHWLYRELGSDSRWSESLHSYECGLLRGRSNTASSDKGILVNLKESCALKPLQLYLYKVSICMGIPRKSEDQSNRGVQLACMLVRAPSILAHILPKQIKQIYI